MALKKTVVMFDGKQIVDAYFRIDSLTVHPTEAMSFCIRGYENVSKPSFIEFVMSCPYRLLGENPLVQAYNYAKTTPEFEGCEDC